jgi:hypothetical protein
MDAPGVPPGRTTLPRSFSIRRQCDSAVYCIQAIGRFPEEFPEIFEGFEVETAPASGGSVSTRMTGALPDQTALISLLRYLDDAGLVLLSLETIDTAPMLGAANKSPEGGTKP